MAEWIGIGRRARRCYGFDEIALVPGTTTVNPAEVDTSWEIGASIRSDELARHSARRDVPGELHGLKFRVPFIASAMDGVVGAVASSQGEDPWREPSEAREPLQSLTKTQQPPE